MGYRFGELTYVGVAEPITQVTFPAFAQMRERGEDWRASFSGAAPGRAGHVLLGALFSGAAEPIVDTLLGDKWAGTIGPLAVFGLWAMLKPLEGTFGWLLNSLEQQGRLAALRALALIPFVPALFIAATTSGITAVAWVMVAHMALLTIAVGLTVRSRGGVPLGDLLGALAPPALGAAACWAASRGVAVALDDAAPALALCSLAAWWPPRRRRRWRRLLRTRSPGHAGATRSGEEPALSLRRKEASVPAPPRLRRARWHLTTHSKAPPPSTISART